MKENNKKQYAKLKDKLSSLTAEVERLRGIGSVSTDDDYIEIVTPTHVERFRRISSVSAEDVNLIRWLHDSSSS